MIILIAQCLLFILGDAWHSFVKPGVFSNLSAFLEEVEVGFKVLGTGKIAYVTQQLLWGEVAEGILNARVAENQRDDNRDAQCEDILTYIASTFRFKSTCARPSSVDRDLCSKVSLRLVKHNASGCEEIRGLRT